jgi:RNA polymerase sigma-70 factor (ECF subfamily)
LLQERRAEFERVMMPHLAAAHDLARWLMRHPQEAEDAVQDAFLKAFRAFDGYAGGNARAWILAITRNTCMTRLRRLRSDSKVVMLDTGALDRDDPMSDLLRDPARGADEVLISESERKRVHGALKKLPEFYREVLIMRELNDLSYREIADAVGVSIGTVMSRLSRGRARMRTLLADDDAPASRRIEDNDHD